MQLEFAYYIRKYKQDKLDELAIGLYLDDEPSDLDNQILDVINRMNQNDI